MQYHVDTHVHVYHCYQQEDFLARIISNIAKVESAVIPVLCLTESQGFDFYHELKSQLNDDSAAQKWHLQDIAGQPAIMLQRDGQNIIVVAGRQIISRQGLEVLALYSDHQYEDGQDTQKIIDLINEKNGLAVLPWGVGKWLGRRGKLIVELLEANDPEKLTIADISARPALWPQPEQFRLGRKIGYNCLYGTDPLPLVHEQFRIGSAGIIAELPADPAQALAELKTTLTKQRPGHFYGRRVSALRFIRDQLMLRIIKQSCLNKSG